MTLRQSFGGRLWPVAILVAAASPAAGQKIARVLAACTRSPRGGEEEARALSAARQALEGGDGAVAMSHLLHALWRHPLDSQLLELALRAAGEEPEARTLWAHALVAARADAAGRVQLTPAERRLMPPADPFPERLLRARAAAVAQLRGFVAHLAPRGSRASGDLVLALWARELARELLRGAPGLAAGSAAAFDTALERFQPEQRRVIAALESLQRRALSSGDAMGTIRAARILRGMAAQAAFKDLQGPRPQGMEKVGARAAAALARARHLLAKHSGAPLDIEQLEEMSAAQCRSFSEQHRSFTDPAVAISPTGLYRIETTCGYGTLLGVVETIELHHHRLVHWFGSDPFDGRQGTIRIVPESPGLQSEGAPFWWVGGFQGGDTTTVKFTCGTIEGLGRALTHELTHRFDGALHPGLPAWLLEGRAVWTAAAYGSSSDETFAPIHASFGTIEQAFIKGYGNARKLRELIRGEVEDYRDNYTAGYALWVYLSTWEEQGRQLYRKCLGPYMDGIAKGARDPEGWFAHHFLDGKDGREENFEDFAKRFGAFLRGFYWQSRAPWTARYAVRFKTAAQAGYVYEDEAWSWLRATAEPRFGQDQAALAGILLEEQGKGAEAAAALAWALRVDEYTTASAERFARLLESRHQAPAAWALRHLGAARARSGATPPAAPFLPAMASLRALLRTWRECVLDLASRGQPWAAQALARDHDRVATLLGTQLIPWRAPREAPAPRRHPLDEVARTIGDCGWIEDGLTGYEERRVGGLWYETEAGDLVVGRHKPRKGTGELDRAAHQRDAFVRSRRWLAAGRYRIWMRIHITTSFVSGAVVLGNTRRDRNVRLNFSAGDFLYSIGRKEEAREIDSVHCRLHSTWVRDGHLPGSISGRRVKFEHPSSSFEVELLVDGAMVHAYVNHIFLGSYHSVDAQPIEGTIGFAMGQGAVRIERPTYQRLDRSAGALLGHPWPLGLDLARGSAGDLVSLRNRPVRGLMAHPRGTIALWMPRGSDPPEEFDAGRLIARARRRARRLMRLLEPGSFPQALVLIAPAEIGEQHLAELGAWLEESAPGRWRVLVHHRSPAPPGSEDDQEAPGETRLLFIDAHGVLRVVAPFSGGVRRLPEGLRHWAKVYRQRPREAQASKSTR